MKRRIAVTSEKGGTGKTTISTTLAGLLAAHGERVLLIDADPQAHATLAFGLPKLNGFYQVMSGNAELADFIRKPDTVRWAIPGETPTGMLYILPGSRDTYGVTNVAEHEEVLREIIEDYEDDVDVVIIDSAPTPGLLMTLLYNAVDAIIVPTQAELFSIDGLLGTIERANKKDIELLGIAPNMYEKTLTLHQHNLNDILRVAQPRNWRVWTPIAKAGAWKEAAQNQRLVYTMPNVGRAKQDALRMLEYVQGALNG
jgi:chromosome partitioning protein